MGFLMLVPSAQWYSYLHGQWERKHVKRCMDMTETDQCVRNIPTADAAHVMRHKSMNEEVVGLLWVIYLLGPCRHERTAVLSAKVSDGSIQHVDLVEEVHS